MRGLASPHSILGASRCVLVFVGFVVDNSGSARLVLLVTKQLALFSLLFRRQAQMRDIMADMDEKDRECCYSSTSSLYMTVTCPVFVLPRCPGLWTFLGAFSGMVSVCFSSVRQWLHVRRQSTVAFGRISYFLRDGSGLVRTGNSNIISTSCSYDVVVGFLPHFAAFFALRPHGRECSFFSPR